MAKPNNSQNSGKFPKAESIEDWFEFSRLGKLKGLFTGDCVAWVLWRFMLDEDIDVLVRLATPHNHMSGRIQIRDVDPATGAGTEFLVLESSVPTPFQSVTQKRVFATLVDNDHLSVRVDLDGTSVPVRTLAEGIQVILSR